MQDRYIVRQAVKNVWCAPEQDNQFILKLTRLTPFNGAVNRYKNMWNLIELPETGVWFHLFQIGQVHPSLLSLKNTSNKWAKLSTACNDKNIIVDVYNYSGIRLPTSEVYYIYTKDQDILIAFKDMKINGFDYNTDDVYFRTYKNTYFESSASDQLTDEIYVEGGLVTSNDHILELQNKIIAKRLLAGKVYCFVNGYKQNDINLVTTHVGDYVEFIHDSSIKAIIDFPLNGLPVFDSVLDSKGKYILHYSGVSNIIDYNDDVEIFLQSASTGKGIYVHKNHRDTLRNITHKDYTIVSSYIENYLQHFRVNGVINTSDLRIRLHVKKSGFERPLVLEKNRINELYKLPDSKILQAFVGVNSNVSVWRATALEDCDYIKVMRSKFNNITKNMCAEMYGYNAIAKQTSNTPSVTYADSGVTKADIPYALSSGCTAFEYDEDGILLGWVQHLEGYDHICQHSDAKYVEFISGLGGDTLDESYTFTNNVIDPYVNYRMYTCGLNGSVYDNVWQDVTWTNAYTVDPVTGALTWNTTNKLTMLRSDRKFFCKNYNVNFVRGILEVPINYTKTILGNVVTDVMKVPLGEITVFMNGKSLIEKLDYRFDSVNGKVYIMNKSYLTADIDDPQLVTIRFTGFCDNQLKHNLDGDFGFIQRGKVSDNHRFDIKDGKVQRIIVNGELRVPSQVSYYDDTGSGTVFNDDNGKPYHIRDLIIPMKNIAEKESYNFKNQSDVIDKEISDYMTLYMNQVSEPTVNVTASKHYLFSPFLARILEDLISGVIDSTPMSTRFTNEFVTSVCKPYEYLLDFDPITVTNSFSRDYVIVHVHRYSNVVALEFSKFRFLSKVIDIYANNLIDETTQIRIA